MDPAKLTQQLPEIQSVAVIGAGISGILTTRYLSEAGLDVTVFERNAEAGGIWSVTSPAPKFLPLCYSPPNPTKLCWLSFRG